MSTGRANPPVGVEWENRTSGLRVERGNVSNEELRRSAAELHRLIVGSSLTPSWSTSTAPEALPDWQRDVLSKILTLTLGQEILYLSTAMPDDNDWDIIAFTQTTVVRVLLVRNDGEPSRTETSVFPRSSLESLELLDAAPIPDDESEWPSDINLIGHYRSATVALPLDRFASSTNRRELVRLLKTLLEDVAL